MHSPELSLQARTHRRGPRTWRAGLMLALATVALFPITANAQTTGDDGETAEDGDYVTTTTTPERSLDVTAFSPECIRDVPFVRYTIVPVGFVPESEHATLVVKDRNNKVIETREVDSLSGRFIFPGATSDANGNATRVPGWKRADDGNWIPDSSNAHLREGIKIEVTVNPTAVATVSFPAATSPCAGGQERALDVSAFAPVCISDAPFIEYDIKTIGFSSTGPATLRFYDVRGRFVEQRVVNSLSGVVVYPGASVSADGTATDWPGWKQATDGSWIPDSSDAILRAGLTIQVEVNPTATAAVNYPPATSACNGPDDLGCIPGQGNDGEASSNSCTPCVPGEDGDGNPADDCTPCIPGQNNDSNPADDCTPCSPGQNNDGDPSDDCTLPKTGGGPGALAYIGGAALLAGMGLLIASRRRNRSGTTPTPG